MIAKKKIRGFFKLNFSICYFQLLVPVIFMYLKKPLKQNMFGEITHRRIDNEVIYITTFLYFKLGIFFLEKLNIKVEFLK